MQHNIEKDKSSILTRERNLNYKVRAERELEAPLLIDRFNKNKLEQYESQKDLYLKDHKEQFMEKLELKQRLARMQQARSMFEEKYRR